MSARHHPALGWRFVASDGGGLRSMKLITAIIRPHKLEELRTAVGEVGVQGVPKPRTSVTVTPWTPTSPTAVRSSSSLCGRMIAVISFMLRSPPPSDAPNHQPYDR